MSIRKRIWQTAEGEEKEAFVVDYKDGAGKRRLKTFARKKDATAWLASTTVDIRQGVHTPESESPTIAEAATAWLESCEAEGLERGTLKQYGEHVRLHLVPFIGSVKLSKLSTPAVHDFREKLRKAGRSPTLIRKVLTSLGSIFNIAREQGRFSGANPASGLNRRKRKATERRQEGRLEVGIDIPTPQEIARLLAAIKPSQPPVVQTAIFTGLRSSELRGLRWIDVDFKHAELHVRQRADAFCEIGAPKSKAGTRTVPIPPGLLTTLKEWKLRCPKSEAGLVFPSARGSIQRLPNIRRDILIPALKKAHIVDKDGKPKYTGLHALRHFYASWLINRPPIGRGLPLKEAQRLLGHASIAMTADTYGHLFPREPDASLADAEAAIRNAT
jgi:integrase